nr:SGNH/GDSL hydrolase family protein [uncultured Solibaculum sp.]
MSNISYNLSMWGDSVLRGVILDEKRGRYTTLKNRDMETSLENMGIQVNNCSRFGYTAPRAKNLLLHTLEDGYRCDAVMLEYGGNDCDFNWAEVAANPEQDHFPNTSLEEFEKCYIEMIEALQKQNIKPILLTLPPLDAVRYLNWITRNGLSRDNILKWLGDVFRIYRFHERYSIAVSHLAKRYGCPLLDIRDAFLSHPDCSQLMCADGIHPNEKGHQVMDKAMLQFASQMC